jgi:hypothetical protein
LFTDHITWTFESDVPEPSSIVLLAPPILGILAVGIRKTRKRLIV